MSEFVRVLFGSGSLAAEGGSKADSADDEPEDDGCEDDLDQIHRISLLS